MKGEEPKSVNILWIFYSLLKQFYRFAWYSTGNFYFDGEVTIHSIYVSLSYRLAKNEARGSSKDKSPTTLGGRNKGLPFEMGVK